MARVTIEDCLGTIENRFALVHIAVKRVKEIFKGSAPQVKCKNKEVVTSLREIAAHKVVLAEETDK
jgi:DNA-directed RNA polymerase subunit omega